MASGYQFPILNSDGTTSSTVVDFEDMFVRKELFLNAGLYAWGFNGNYVPGYTGLLGQNDIVHRSSPVQVGSLTNWKQIAGGLNHNMAIKTDGTLWGIGNNSYGQLGVSTSANAYSSPIQVGSLTNWKQIASKNDNTAAINTNNELWVCGDNFYGQIGNSSTSIALTYLFKIIGNWKQAVCGLYHTTAIKTDGTLWAWGHNSSGQLGGGPTGTLGIVHTSSPVQVGSLTNWKQIAGGGYHTVAIKTDGTLWAWGHNANGQLGGGPTGTLGIVHTSSPVQVGSLTNWKQVSAGNFHMVAIKTDGTLWAWGHNSSGQLGLIDIVHRSSPVQVGSLTNWKLVAGGYYHTAAIKTDGTLWSWGRNTNGQLGLQDIVHRSSPVQVGLLTNWKLVAGGGYHTTTISSPDLP